ncbi:Btn2p SCDLUD_000062 [Saccharomycodes ludwigii]|uniref:Btn2p n=1 Tax=Saccharomycodes ludwigii TaxID=36035 RepID=UPI001E8B5566|nr:hypothetical protein SCDLUD_000062 [Saccharomycodes ludwigii]KAH3902485.1 hypothetical protein SCDLUD_000062 [Saccharomycodes ludwigii]
MFPFATTIPVFPQRSINTYCDPFSPQLSCPPISKNYYRKRQEQEKVTAPFTYEFKKGNSESVLSLYKQVPSRLFSKIVEKHILSHPNREQFYDSDFFGNYYINEDRVLDILDMDKVGTEVARKLFASYQLTLNHEGNELLIENASDGSIIKIFKLDDCYSDFSVKSLNLVGPEKDKAALILVLCKDKKEILSSQKIEKERKEQKKDSKKLKQEQKRKNKFLKKKTQQRAPIQEISPKKGMSEGLKEETEQIKKTCETNMSKSKVKDAKQKDVQEKLQKEKKLLSEKLSDYRNNTSMDNGKSFHRERLDASERNSRRVTKSQVESRSRSLSPVLEDVEDAELTRYNRSLHDSPKGNAVLEDA